MTKNLYKQKREEGFTIIEVLIVLAIAGLIILIVFLAVPALQRNSRNTQRNNDASQIITSVNECLTNRNGQTGSCDEVDEIQGLDTSKLRILTAVTVNPVTAAPAFPNNSESVNAYYGRKCTDAGDNFQNGTQRQFVALFNTETAGGDNVSRCLDS